MIRCRKDIYEGDVCTWHGGVNSWEKADWSPIYGREVWIWPDNDEAGFKCANRIKQTMLKKNKCKVKVIDVPKDFQEKDDLWDAYQRGDFKSSEDIRDLHKQAAKKRSQKVWLLLLELMMC